MDPAPRRAAAIWKQFLPAQAKTTPVQAPRADAICERWIATARHGRANVLGVSFATAGRGRSGWRQRVIL